MVGVLLAGAISVFVSPSLVETYFGNEFFSMLFMLVLATPLYVCATASTPIAAALVLKGISPGAALVFLLAGPATNVATITVVAKIIGKRAAFIYVSSILICSFAMGWLVNLVYRLAEFNILNWSNANQAEELGFIAYGSTFILLGFILRGIFRKLKQRFQKSVDSAGGCIDSQLEM